MHDPMTVAFRIPNPFARHHDPEARKRRDPFHGAWSNRPALATIWHLDPEKDGSDDSCDWFGRWCGDKDANEREAKAMASWAETGYGPRYFDQPDVPQVMLLPIGFEENSPRENTVFHGVSHGDALALTLMAFETIAWQMERRKLSTKMMRVAISMARESGCRMFGAHIPKADRIQTFRFLISEYWRNRRPWWRHPRWHFWHWRIQIPAQRRFVAWVRGKKRESDQVGQVKTGL